MLRRIDARHAICDGAERLGVVTMLTQKPLQKAEMDLLSVIVRLHGARGPVNRDVLSVEARGQGLEFGRALSVLRGMGLVEEVVKKPFFLARLFGVKPVAQIRPTAAGLALLAPPPAEAEETRAPEPEAVAEAVVPEPAAEAPQADVAPIPEVDAALDGGWQEEAVPAEAEAAADLAPEAEPVAPQDKPAAPAPEAPAPRPRAPKPLPLNLYTEDLGGTPDEDVPLVAAFRVDPEILDGLRDTLDVVGMPLTFAGEALVADRVAKGMSPGDALMQVALYAIAHAIRLDGLAGGRLDMTSLAQYVVELLDEMDRLRQAEAITAERYAEDSAAIAAMIADADNRMALADALLSDPVGGAAPPALLPEDLRLPDDDIGEPSY